MQSVEDVIIQEVEKRPHLYKFGKIDVDNKQRKKDFDEIAQLAGMKHMKGIQVQEIWEKIVESYVTQISVLGQCNEFNEITLTNWQNINFTRLIQLSFLYDNIFGNEKILSNFKFLQDVQKTISHEAQFSKQLHYCVKERTFQVARDAKILEFKQLLDTLSSEETSTNAPAELMNISNSITDTESYEEGISLQRECDIMKTDGDDYYRKRVRSMIGTLPKSKITQFYSNVIEIVYFYKNGSFF